VTEPERGAEGSPPPQAGWYPDPSGAPGFRWWNGSEWTAEHRDQPPPPATKTSGFAIAALIFGIIGGPLFAVVFGLVARSRIARSGGTLGGRGIATAGIVLGCLWAALYAVLIVLGLNGAFDEQRNAERYRGEERAVATVVDRFEEYADAERFGEICRDLFTPRWTATLEESGRECEAIFRDEVEGKVQAEIEIERIALNGDRAEVTADEGGEPLRVVLVQQGGGWRIDALR
jgi:hypothetical protein